MNFNELLLGSITMDQTVASFKTETRQTGSVSSGVSFARVLDSRMNDPAIRADNNRSHQVGNTTGQTASKGEAEKSAPLYRSYRQLRESLRNTGDKARTVAASAHTEERIPEDGKDHKSGKMAAVNVIQILAQMFGVDQEKLEKLLSESGISPEVLNSLENTEQTAMVLSEAFGLDQDQSDTLERLLEILKDAAEESLNEMIQERLSYGAEEIDSKGHQTEDALQYTVKAIGAGTETPVTASDPQMEELISAISEKLDEFGEMLATEQEAAEDEIKNLLVPMLRKAEAVKSNVTGWDQTGQADAGQTEGTINPVTDKTQVSELPEKDTAGDNEQSDLQMEDGGSEQEFLPKPLQHEGENIQYQFAVISPDNTETEAVGHIAAERQTLPARDIINQIVEKAGAVIAPDKAEMVMELKPESLGRISLKVVTENGIVMAKFVAENRQVQQVLETNMQILKDSLERQGINVQSLSVSVRQDGRQPEDNRQQYGSPRRIGDSRNMNRVMAVESSSIGSVSAAAERNPYLWESSTINLTA